MRGVRPASGDLPCCFTTNENGIASFTTTRSGSGSSVTVAQPPGAANAARDRIADSARMGLSFMGASVTVVSNTFWSFDAGGSRILPSRFPRSRRDFSSGFHEQRVEQGAMTMGRVLAVAADGEIRRV